MNLQEWSKTVRDELDRKEMRARRERIAAMAMQGLLASETVGDEYVEGEVAMLAVGLADALIAELDKGEK